MDEEAKRPQVDWAAIRCAYEMTDETIKDICLRFGVTKSALEHRLKKQRWLSRRAAKINVRSSTRDRLYAVLERQVTKLANADGATLGDKEAQQLTELVKTFERLSGTRDDVPENGGPSENKDMRDLRSKLAKRLEQRDRR